MVFSMPVGRLSSGFIERCCMKFITDICTSAGLFVCRACFSTGLRASSITRIFNAEIMVSMMLNYIAVSRRCTGLGGVSVSNSHSVYAAQYGAFLRWAKLLPISALQACKQVQLR